MSRTVYVNGAYVPEADAKISVFDRAFLFGDGVYEVTAVIDGRPIDFAAHMARLQRSLDELSIPQPLSEDAIETLHTELIARNGLDQGGIYFQITRGPADRDFGFPASSTPTVIAFTQAKTLEPNPLAETGVHVVTVPDIRWRRRDIKSTALLAQVLAKQAARDAGAFEAWMVEDGRVTEGSSSNAFIVSSQGALVTRPLTNDILAGVTRRAVLRLADEEGASIEERAFSPGEARTAAEAFMTSASSLVLPVVSIDGHRIGDGRPGPVTKTFRRLYLDEAVKG